MIPRTNNVEMTERREKSLIGWVLVIHLPLMITQSVSHLFKQKDRNTPASST